MNTLPNTTTFLTIQDTAKMLKVSTKTLRRWEAKEILVPVRTAGGHRRYTAAQVREYKDSLKIKKTKPQLTGPVLVEEAVIEKETPVIASQAATSPVVFTASTKEVDPFEFVSPIQAQTNNIRTESVVLSKPKQKKLSAKILASSVFLAGLIVMATAVLSATGFSKPGASALNGNEAQVLASKDTLQTLNLNINIPAEFRSTLSVGEAFTANSTATVAGQLAVTSGDITTNGVTLSLDAPLTQLTGNLAIGGTSITSAADLTINPTGGGTRIGTATPTSVDLAGSDLFVSGDIETAGVAYIPTLSINGDEFTDLTGSGLQVSSGTLATTLGTSVTGDEIEDDSIKEVDLNISNAPTSGQTLTYNSSTGGFTWASVASLFTDGGAVTYLTDTTDNFSVGTTSSLATIAAVGGSDQIQLLARANSTQTSNIFEVQNSAGTSRFSVDNTGNTLAAGSSTVGSLIINSDTFTDLTGNGLQVSGNTLTLSLPTATDALSSTTSTGSGLEVLSTGLTLLQGCSTGQVLKWNEANDSWECGNDTGGSAAIVNVYTDGTPVGASVDTINFGTDFTVTASPTNQANVSVADDALNFSELSDSLVLDAATTITAGSALSLTIGNNATLTTTGTGSIIATNVV
nr:helix-turn-helix domain-containing protein [Candidatus Woesebacteria bacterium]